MTRIMIAALVLALSAGVADAKSCKDPKTGKFIKCPPPVTNTTSSTSSSGGAPHCTTGVPCGHSCIAKGKVCHK